MEKERKSGQRAVPGQYRTRWMEMRLEESKIREFFTILKKEAVKTVFQPIVSLETGEIFAYEALSRITIEKPALTIDQLFDMANQMGQLWNLERLCRGKALQEAADKPEGAKIFLNVDGNIILDNEFVCGFTKDFLKKYGLQTRDIVFELTERTSVDNRDTFRRAVNHYKRQSFEIAIDDAGSGYSNLNRISFVEPNYIKIDMELIREIHLSKAKRSIVGIMAKFCKEMGSVLIAEGIETEDELKCLVEMGIPYGQGYYFSRPSEGFMDIPEEKKQWLLGLQPQGQSLCGADGLLKEVKSICKETVTIEPEEEISKAYKLFVNNSDLSEICIVDKENRFHGIVMRKDLICDTL